MFKSVIIKYVSTDLTETMYTSGLEAPYVLTRASNTPRVCWALLHVSIACDPIRYVYEYSHNCDVRRATWRGGVYVDQIIDPRPCSGIVKWVNFHSNPN